MYTKIQTQPESHVRYADEKAGIYLDVTNVAAYFVSIVALVV